MSPQGVFPSNVINIQLYFALVLWIKSLSKQPIDFWLLNSTINNHMLVTLAWVIKSALLGRNLVLKYKVYG